MTIDGHMITLDGHELATAIDAYLTAHRVSVSGPRTVSVIVDGERTVARDVAVRVYVDPSGRLVDNREASL